MVPRHVLADIPQKEGPPFVDGTPASDKILARRDAEGGLMRRATAIPPWYKLVISGLVIPPLEHHSESPAPTPLYRWRVTASYVD